ncbi:MAG TPA: ABC transporter permease subunit, partial [Corynebacterium sp.]|nr:ABC transporter permease subunit [Corynebacterium sp.]
MNQISLTWAFLTDADRWPLILSRTLDHLGYTALAVGLSLLIALPLGLWVGHSRRGADVVLSVAGALRALPSLGLLTWLTVSMSVGVRMPLVPSTIVLILLAVPPLLAGIVAGMVAVPRQVVDSARASGYSEGQILS